MVVGIQNSVQAQTSSISSDIVSALSNGDANRLSTYLNDNVELFIENKNDIYSRQQAVSILNDFFHRYKVSDFKSYIETRKFKFYYRNSFHRYGKF